MDKKRAFKIVYEDDVLFVVDKSAGLLVVPTPKDEKRTLVNLVNQALKSKCPGSNRRGLNGQYPNAYPAHRLDRGTSGLVIFSKGKAALANLTEQFKKRVVHKTYLAIVNGRVKNPKGEINIPLATDPKTYAVFPTQNKRIGQSSLTRYRILTYLKGATLLEVEPKTGRTNQVRVHLACIGHPLIGERKYAVAKDYPIKFRRAALHAEKISFRHPTTGKMLFFKTPVPEDMRKFIETRQIFRAN
ncbi:MAG: RluA family pseudouridine synthase [bacterium]